MRRWPRPDSGAPNRRVKTFDDAHFGPLRESGIKHINSCTLSNLDPLYLVERDLIAGAVVELGGARAFVHGHGLGVFERVAGLEIGGEPVARNTWQPSLILKPASAVRLRTMRYASMRFIGLSVSTPVFPTAERNRGSCHPPGSRPRRDTHQLNCSSL
jgi:hypothetical protein